MTDETADIDASKAPLLDHLIELRGRLLKCVIAFALCFALTFSFASRIFGFLVQPLVHAYGDGVVGKLIYTKLYEAFFVEIKVAAFAALCLAFPIIANQLWAFVAPGLYKREKRAFLPFLLATPILFTMGASLAYFFVMPAAFRFFLGFQSSSEVTGITQEALPAMGEYLSLVMNMILGFGVAFLLPVLLMLLERAGIVTRTQLKAGRRYAIVGAFAIAAVLTPPDIWSQFALAIPLILLYEISIISIWLTERRRAAASNGARQPAE
ncbi:Sec-independent protein translocase protein TatC [Polymorphobacter glacialis]|uniref:Sec-independent protein translocase protein TatC n=1 Tax=Sandarakinorhabdus glacialis TaxID=1614636 RepID=A0A917A058_9SPHN|nr:twin-arginine translocase subunit TatC [Polymorphobacter glacialis]GGE21067.1 Sec-independent protein translocase protein TatC [Polymorphobacter glacialis]